MSRVLALVAALLVGAVPARGQTPDKPNPVYIQQGTASDGAIVSCATSSTELLNCPTASGPSGGWRAVTCYNDGTNKVYVCPHRCSGCVSGSYGFVVLGAGSSFTFGGAARALQLSCQASGGASTVRCFAER